MKTALIAAGVLATVTLANPPVASAKDLKFGLTIDGPNGFFHVGSPGPYLGSKHGYNGYDSYKRGYAESKHGYNGYGSDKSGYAHSYNGYYDLPQARAYGHCLCPQEIGRRLHNYGWNDFRVLKLQPNYAVAYSYRHDDRYRINVDRCTGAVVKAEPLYRYGPQGY